MGRQRQSGFYPPEDELCNRSGRQMGYSSINTNYCFALCDALKRRAPFLPWLVPSSAWALASPVCKLTVCFLDIVAVVEQASV